MDTVEIVTISELPNYRARIEYDIDPSEPYDDGATPIIRLEGRYWDSYGVETFNMQGAPYVDAIRRLLESHGLDIVERYLKIFHGSLKVQTYNVGISREYGYVAFDTAAWRAAMGITDTERLATEDYLSEVRSWSQGDVYGVIIERNVSYTKTFNDENRDAEECEDWEELESCWGYYGDYALQAAKDTLSTYIEGE